MQMSEPSMSETQAKRAAKVIRLRKYFGDDRPEIYGWSTTDENLDFSKMSDAEVAQYLAKDDPDRP